ncbi:hypothetical protein 22 [Diadegma semiclausum ichnovirus]|nr:hypothetical protein 22 [Diadegma semiclausum ichnovirus]
MYTFVNCYYPICFFIFQVFGLRYQSTVIQLKDAVDSLTDCRFDVLINDRICLTNFFDIVTRAFSTMMQNFLTLQILLPRNYKMLVVVLLTLTVVLAGVYYIARQLADLVAITNMYLDDLGHGGLMRYSSTTHKEDRVE